MLSTNQIVAIAGVNISVSVSIVSDLTRDRNVIVNITRDGVAFDSLTFTPADNMKTVIVPVEVDNVIEPDQTFTINFIPVNNLDTFVTNTTVDVTILESKLYQQK